jgi:hypothetical protein
MSSDYEKQDPHVNNRVHHVVNIFQTLSHSFQQMIFTLLSAVDPTLPIQGSNLPWALK